MPENSINAEQQSELDNLFSYHKPFGDQPSRYENIRAKAKELAAVIIASTPKSADQSAALRKLRECVMTANAAIAINEVDPGPLPSPSADAPAAPQDVAPSSKDAAPAADPAPAA